MARPLRIERAGGWYHVTARGNERRPIFRDDRDRGRFCDLLEEVVGRFRVHLHAFVLMENHYHLMVELAEANLSRTGQWLNVAYSVWFNRRHGRSGHLFQGRFKSVVVDPLEWGLELSRYVHLNPVRVGRWASGKGDRQRMRMGGSGIPDDRQVKDRIGWLRQYRWSSYRAYIGLGKKPDWLECDAVLELGGARKEERMAQYREYVESAMREGLAKSPWEHLRDQVVLGGAGFLEQLRSHVSGNAREQPGARRLAQKCPTLTEIIAAVEAAKRQRWPEFRDRHGDSGRDLVLYLARRTCGLKLEELAAATGMRDYSAVSIAVRRFERRLERSKQDREQLKRVCQLSNVEM